MAPKLRLRIWAMVICLLVGLVTAGAEDPGEKPPASVALVVPYQTILADELIQFTVRLRNDSKEDLPYIADSYEAPGKQVFVKVERGDASYAGPWHVEGSADFLGSRVRTVERDGRWDVVVKKATAALRPGEAVEWDGSRFSELLFFITDGDPKSIQAQVLVGPGRWVSSKRIPVKVIAKDLSSSPVVFEGVYLVGPQGIKRPVKIRRVPVGGKEYLFSGFRRPRGRICEIPKGATPEFGWDPETAVLTVRFAGVDAPPVRYDCKMMRRLPDRGGAEPRPPANENQG